MDKKTGKALVEFYNIPAKAAYYHGEGNWYWNLEQFPGAYFDANGYVAFQTESDYLQCNYLTIGPRNTGVRGKNSGISLADIPGYQKLNPAPCSL